MPALVVVAVLVPFLGFYVARVNNYRDFLHARGFRLLELATVQLQSEIDGMKFAVRAANKVAGELEQRKVDGLAAAGRKPEEEVRAYLQKYLRDGELDSIVFDPPVEGAKVSGKESLSASLASRSPLAPLGLRLAYLLDNEDKLSVHVPMEKLAGRLLPGDSKEFFDLVLLATEDGKLLGSAGEATLRFTHVNALLKDAKPAEPPGLFPFLSRSGSSGANGQAALKVTTADVASGQQRLTIQFSGDEYALFLQPAPIRLAIEPGSGAAAGATQLLIGGLVRTAVLEGMATAMPTSDPAAVFLCLSSILVLSWPALKLATMSPKERLRPAPMALLAVAALGASVVLTQVYIAYGFRLGLHQQSVANLRELSGRLRANFNEEIRAAVRMLETSRKGYAEPPGKLQTFHSIEEALRPVKHFREYPFFSHLYVIEPLDAAHENYRQKWKLSADQLPTPLIEIRPANYPALVQLRGRSVGFPAGAPSKASEGGQLQPVFGLQTILSNTTGEYLTLAAVEDDEAERGRRYRMLSTKLISLGRPLMPAGYQFAVLDRSGVVKYHSEPFRAGRENFLRECLNPGDLAPFLGGQRSGLARLEYGGRHVRAWVARLGTGSVQSSGIIGLDWILVTFRETGADDETVFQAGLIQLALAATCLLLGGVVYLLAVAAPRIAVPPARSLASERRFWPRARHRGQYVVEIAVLGIAVLVILLLTAGDWGGEFRRAGPVVLPLAWAAGVAAWIGATRRPGAGQWRRIVAWVSRSLANVSLTAVFSLRWALRVIFFVGCGSLASFPATVRVLELLNEVRAQQDAERQLAERAGAVSASVKAMGMAGETAALIAQRKAVEYDLVDVRASARFQSESAVEPLSSQGWFVAPLLRLAMPVVSVTQEGWPQTAEGLTLRVPAANSMAAPPAWLAFPAAEWVWHYLLLGCALAGLVYLWFHFVFDRLFVYSFEDPRWQSACQPEELAVLLRSSRRLLVFTHPQANSTATVQWLAAGLRESEAAAKVHVVDLAVALTLDDTVWPALVAETRAQAAGGVLIVDNLEFRFNAEPVRLRSLQLLEQASAANPAHVCIVSSVDPVLSLESASSEDPERRQELARWIRAMAGFERISFDHPYDLEPERQRLAALPSKHLADCQMIFNREFDRTYYLRTLVPRIMKDFDPAKSPTPAHFEAFVVNRTLRLADGLYRMLWNTTTPDERLVLYQLAADGWVNPMNRVAVAHLVRKRLIFLSATAGALKERGALEVMNESFRRFVLTAADPAELRRWESDEQGVLWRGMRLGLLTALVLAAAWVSYVRRDLFDTYVGYLAAATGGSAAVLKWLVDMLRRPGESKEGK